MAEQQRGIAISLSNRRPILTDDPEYDRLLLAAINAEAEMVRLGIPIPREDELQPHERAYAEQLLPQRPTMRAMLGGRVPGGGVRPSGPVRDPRSEEEKRAAGAAALMAERNQRPLGRLLGSLLTDAPPRAPLPLRANAEQPRPMPPTAGQMFLDAGLGTLQALDQPPAGMPEGAAYTTPLRLLSASAAVPSALAARAYDASSRGSVMGEAPVVDPLRPAEDQSMFSTAIAQRGGGRGAQAVGFLADLLTPDFTDAFTGGLLPLAAMAGGIKKVKGAATAARALTGGFYSRLDEAAAMIPKKGVPAPAVLNWMKKAPEGISLEEAAYRKLPEWLESQGGKTVTPEMLAAHLRENPAPFPKVKTLGGGVTHKFAPPEQQAAMRSRVEHLRGEMGRLPHGSPEYRAAVSEYQDAYGQMRESVPGWGIAPSGETTKFSRYQVPGGESYRETLQTLPSKSLSLDDFAKQYREFDPSVTPDQLQRAYAKYAKGDSAITIDNQAEFRSTHYPDDPNILVHTRANERTLPTGERGRFVEEVQSDWHQKGKREGYRGPGPEDTTGWSAHIANPNENPARHFWVVNDARGRAVTHVNFGDAIQNHGVRTEAAAIQQATRRVNPESGGAVPDAPFKENWQDLGLKQQLIETANDPNAEWMGFTGGKTQADRYDLSKQINALHYAKHGDGYWLAADLKGGGEHSFGNAIPADKLSDYVGKDMAGRIIEGAGVARDAGGGKTLSGLDLQVGGEGMRAFYDQKLPKRLEKILKPFGGTVEAGDVSHPQAIPSYPDDLEYMRGFANSGGLTTQQTPMWFSRLTPEMKARILKEGLPLMGLAGLTLGNLLGKKQEPARDRQ